MESDVAQRGRPAALERWREKATQTLQRPGLQRVAQWGIVRYFRNIAFDYWTVFSDAARTARSRPFRSALGAAAAALLWIVHCQNPHERSYYHTLTASQHELLLLGPAARSSASDNYFHHIQRLVNAGRLRHLNCFFFSLVWLDDCNGSCDVFYERFDRFRPRWWHVPQRVVDIGLLNRWVWQWHYMRDFDVNDDEWSDAPMASAAPAGSGAR